MSERDRGGKRESNEEAERGRRERKSLVSELTQKTIKQFEVERVKKL